MMGFGIHSLMSGLNILFGLCLALVIFGSWKISRIVSRFNTFDFDRDDMQKIYQDYKQDVREINRTICYEPRFYHDAEFDVDESRLVLQEIPVENRTIH